MAESRCCKASSMNFQEANCGGKSNERGRRPFRTMVQRKSFSGPQIYTGDFQQKFLSRFRLPGFEPDFIGCEGNSMCYPPSSFGPFFKFY
ncbi:hypothetical protein CEXT_497681 [Caerostris extrusa]|uniref:Uncharacterized protein n=1 Tax=Caerostris extrusa TaxID=172846 RepID=A0AAV4XQP6_CAEEX|nr:hypothetical protein CEXT_497681 [Caerostris extrusa]